MYYPKAQAVRREQSTVWGGELGGCLTGVTQDRASQVTLVGVPVPDRHLGQRQSAEVGRRPLEAAPLAAPTDVFEHDQPRHAGPPVRAP